MRSVSEILADDHQITIRPGNKGECPTCRLPHFSVKGDDSLGKCFHPPCGHYLTRESAHDGYGLSRVLQTLYHDCHQELLTLAGTPGNHAYSYLAAERGVHPQVIADAMLGSVPNGCNVAGYFGQALQAAQDAFTALKAQGKKGAKHAQALERAEQRVTELQAAQQALHDCVAHRAGWLIFFYTDSGHHLVALRMREPYSRKFVSFKPGIAGVFGRELFTPSTAPGHQAANDYLLVTEGEFNVLTLQSLTRYYEEATQQPLGYVHCCAVGGVANADAETLRRSATRPVLWFDHDANGAGLTLVHRLQQAMPLEGCTSGICPSDLDSFILDFRPDAVAAWHAVQAVLQQRQRYGRSFSGTGEEFFATTITSPTRQAFIPKLLGDVLLARDAYRFAASQLWVYRDGVYHASGEAHLRTDGQTLLGEERKESRLLETLAYVSVATQDAAADGSPHDTTHINLRSGLLDWKTHDIMPHSPAVFRVAQLPVVYDPDATSPAFQRYLDSTFDADVHPLIEEVLGWCLIPDRRFEKAVMLTGETGENGKSVLIDLIGYLLGEENVAHVALQDLEENRFRVAELFGKLANLFADLDTRSMQSSSMFKTLVTGDRITAERKHQHPFTFRNYAKLIFSANKIPSSKDRTPAFYRRWIIIPFTRTFDGKGSNPQPDKGLRETLTAELPGILNRALTGLARLQANQAFTEPASVAAAKANYERQNDNVRAFLGECIDFLPIGSIEKAEFYKTYGAWCEASGERAVSQKALKTTLEQHVPQLDTWRNPLTGKWEWVGMEWNTDARDYFPATFHVNGRTPAS